jgi:tRNA(fMet)-specific endonuclease VapC
MKFLLDTNICIKIINAKSPAAAQMLGAALKRGEMVGLPALTYHELQFGVFRSQNPEKRRAQVELFMEQLEGVVSFNEEDGHIAAQLRTALLARGNMIGPYDVLIAAQAIRLGATLVSANVREFERVPGLTWEDWTKA